MIVKINVRANVAHMMPSHQPMKQKYSARTRKLSCYRSMKEQPMVKHEELEDLYGPLAAHREHNQGRA
jgi:hypothetical protein